MLFREIIAVYSENHTEHINTLCGQNAVYINSVRTSQETYYVSTTNHKFVGEGVTQYRLSHFYFSRTGLKVTSGIQKSHSIAESLVT
jgi:hypothetical protein